MTAIKSRLSVASACERQQRTLDAIYRSISKATKARNRHMTEKTETSNVKELTLPKDQNEAAAEALIRIAPSLARMRKSLFDSYISAGFTIEQALMLCTK